MGSAVRSPTLRKSTRIPRLNTSTTDPCREDSNVSTLEPLLLPCDRSARTPGLAKDGDAISQTSPSSWCEWQAESTGDRPERRVAPPRAACAPPDRLAVADRPALPSVGFEDGRASKRCWFPPPDLPAANCPRRRTEGGAPAVARREGGAEQPRQGVELAHGLDLQ